MVPLIILITLLAKVCRSAELEVATMGSILFEDTTNYEGQLGALIANETGSGVSLFGSFAGLEPSTSTHWHAFSGDCDAMDEVADHFDVAVDPTGYASLDVMLQGISLNDFDAIEILNDTGRVGCGALYDAVGASIMPYGDFTAKGVLIVIDHCDPCHIHLNGALGGLDTEMGLIKIHEGSSCDDVGDAYAYTSAYDPWENQTYVTDDGGNAQINVFSDVFTAAGQYPVEGLPVVVYDDRETPLGCGLLSYMYV